MKTKLNLTVMAVASAFVMISCGGNENQKTIKNLEKCLGTMKTIEDSSNISEEEAIAIANCMLPHLQAVKDKVDKMSREEAEKFLKELEFETEKSDYKEIIKELNYRKVKKLANLKQNDDSEDWDKIIDDYEEYVDEYIKFVRSIDYEDSSSMSEYATLLEKAERLSSKLERAENDLSKSQLSRMTKIQNKMNNAVLEMQ
jgi:hypothetical protein